MVHLPHLLVTEALKSTTLKLSAPSVLWQVLSHIYPSVDNLPSYLKPSYIIMHFLPTNHFSVHLNPLTYLKLEAVPFSETLKQSTIHGVKQQQIVIIWTKLLLQLSPVFIRTWILGFTHTQFSWLLV